jgi:flavin-dependent dehydrogenase
MGDLIPGRQEDAEIHFLRGLEGYLWVFPRLERLSVGICGKGESSASLRARLEKFMATRGMAAGQAEFFAHAIPCLEPDAWTRNRVAGDGWLAAGDAAGLVDPLTGEGISYAIRSGDLAAQTLLDDGVAAEGKPAAYRRILKEEMMDELAAGSRLSRPFFRERFLWGSVPARMIWLLRRHETFRAVAGDLVAGTLSYRNLKQRLVEAAEGSAAGLVLRAGLALRRVISSRRTAGAGWKQWQGEEAS